MGVAEDLGRRARALGELAEGWVERREDGTHECVPFPGEGGGDAVIGDGMFQ